MARARDCILERGGLQAANITSRSTQPFGLIRANTAGDSSRADAGCPANFIYQMSSWTEPSFVSLSIVHDAPTRVAPVAGGFSLEELFFQVSLSRSTACGKIRLA